MTKNVAGVGEIIFNVRIQCDRDEKQKILFPVYNLRIVPSMCPAPNTFFIISRNWPLAGEKASLPVDLMK